MHCKNGGIATLSLQLGSHMLIKITQTYHLRLIKSHLTLSIWFKAALEEA